MSTDSYIPVVKEGHAFREISQDFSKPAEIFREAIANALDAYAKRIWLRVQVLNVKGRDKVNIFLSDDGIGVDETSIKAFLNLSDSCKPADVPTGMERRRMTGYKGHGTKVYFNSERVEILSKTSQGQAVHCLVDDPRGHLSEGSPPPAIIKPISTEELKRLRTEWGFPELADGKGTTIRVVGYHENAKKGLEHTLLVDYVRWFTRWGSWEPKCAVTETPSTEVKDFSQCSLFLRGLAKSSPDTDENIPFGHVFPTEDCTDLRRLREKDAADPLKFYVRTWAFEGVPLIKNPDKRMDFIFAIEGEGARRQYNDMLRRQGKPRRPGDYLSEERYGLWLCRDYVPIQRFNSWVAERSEYTRMHAFVNCDSLNLTANRGSVENTQQELLEDIEATVRKVFEDEVESHSDFSKFHDELFAIERQRHASKETTDFKRRLKRLEGRECVTINGVEFLSPVTETDVIALVSGVQALLPDVLPFVVRDYDSHFGFDGLATRNRELAITETTHLFVEFKVELKSEFNHTFSHLEAVLCWTSKLKHGSEVTDLGGVKGIYEIRTDSATSKKTRFIMVPGSPRNVEVISFKELLESKGHIFKPIGE